MIEGRPDLGWRRRYNAEGTEEWARDPAITTPPAATAGASRES
jgi:hypothetical protein